MVLKKSFKTELLEAGCDEAGRGCLAGPVFAAAVILPENYENPLLNDSKLISAATRNILREDIEKNAVCYAVAMVSNEEIDKINILQASVLAMHKAISKLKPNPGHLIIDGNYFKKYENIPHKCVIHGDALYLSIAAASILAKTYRDDYMIELHKAFSCYAWDANKGYATKKHREAIEKFGISKHHRRSFKLFDTQLKIPY